MKAVTTKLEFKNDKYFKKAFVFDIDPLLFYRPEKDLELLVEAIKAISRYQNILFIGACWNQLLDSIKQLINKNARISLLSGSGACYFSSQSQKFSFFNFIDPIRSDFIIHMATSTVSGVIVQGVDADQRRINDLTNIKSVVYFLNFLNAKQVKNQWKLKMNLGYDYYTFKNSVNEMKISEIYFFENKMFAAPKLLLNNIIDSNENIGMFLDPTLIKTKQVSENVADVYAFTSVKNNVYLRILDYLKEHCIDLKDTYYFSVNSYDLNCLNKLPNVIVSSDLVSRFHNKPLFVYEKNIFSQLGSFLFESSNVWRNIEI